MKSRILAVGLALAAALAGCSGSNEAPPPPTQTPAPTPTPAATSDGPGPLSLPARFVHRTGDNARGQDVFRFETFGNEGFWTNAMRLPQGMAEQRVTPLQALQIGLSININSTNAETRGRITQAVAQINAGTRPDATALGDASLTMALINQNAVIGMVAFAPNGSRKPLGGSGTLNLAAGDRVGVSCAACHSIADGSTLPAMPLHRTTGTIGAPVDGPTPHQLDIGRIFATAANSLAYLPFLQFRFDTMNGATIGRGSFPGLNVTANSIPQEAEVDRYLTEVDAGTGERFYPLGQFDDTGDGIGNPLHIAALFRQDLAAPFGIDAGNDRLEDFNNNVFVNALDPTALLTAPGREFLRQQAGASGLELADDYERVLRATGVIPAGRATLDVVPFVRARTGFTPGTAEAPTGRRVDEQALVDMNGYLDSLPSPRRPADVNLAAAERGREFFRTLASSGGGGCTACHQVNPNMFLPPDIVEMTRIYPGYAPIVLAMRMPPLAPIQNSGGPSPFFDDREIVIEGSRNGTVRGATVVFLLDLPRKTALLHDDSVRGGNFTEAANRLLDPARGAQSAHPFFISDATRRAEVIEFLRSLQTDR
jgi:hypothetical protein